MKWWNWRRWLLITLDAIIRWRTACRRTILTRTSSSTGIDRPSLARINDASRSNYLSFFISLFLLYTASWTPRVCDRWKRFSTFCGDIHWRARRPVIADGQEESRLRQQQQQSRRLLNCHLRRPSSSSWLTRSTSSARESFLLKVCILLSRRPSRPVRFTKPALRPFLWIRRAIDWNATDNRGWRVIKFVREASRIQRIDR